MDIQIHGKDSVMNAGASVTLEGTERTFQGGQNYVKAAEADGHQYRDTAGSGVDDMSKIQC